MLNYKTRTSGAPPVPPQRYSSMRGSAPGTPPTGITTAPTFGGNNSSNSSSSNNANAVSRLVIDLEAKYGKHFHNVTEFPKPPPFVNIQKVYPSRTVKTANVTTASSNNNNINNNNNNITTTDNNNLNTNTTIANVTTTTTTTTTPKPLQPAGYQPFIKKHRAPAPPPPQAGVAAATVSVIRQSSFLYGAAGIGHQHTQ